MGCARDRPGAVGVDGNGGLLVDLAAIDVRHHSREKQPVRAEDFDQPLDRIGLRSDGPQVHPGIYGAIGAPHFLPHPRKCLGDSIPELSAAADDAWPHRSPARSNKARLWSRAETMRGSCGQRMRTVGSSHRRPRSASGVWNALLGTSRSCCPPALGTRARSRWARGAGGSRPHEAWFRVLAEGGRILSDIDDGVEYGPRNAAHNLDLCVRRSLVVHPTQACPAGAYGTRSPARPALHPARPAAHQNVRVKEPRSSTLGSRWMRKLPARGVGSSRIRTPTTQSRARTAGVCSLVGHGAPRTSGRSALVDLSEGPPGTPSEARTEPCWSPVAASGSRRTDATDGLPSVSRSHVPPPHTRRKVPSSRSRKLISFFQGRSSMRRRRAWPRLLRWSSR